MFREAIINPYIEWFLTALIKEIELRLACTSQYSHSCPFNRLQLPWLIFKDWVRSNFKNDINSVTCGNWQLNSVDLCK